MTLLPLATDEPPGQLFEQKRDAGPGAEAHDRLVESIARALWTRDAKRSIPPAREEYAWKRVQGEYMEQARVALKAGA